jgi:hypothetical protein
MIVNLNVIVYELGTLNQVGYYRKRYDLPFAPFVGLRFTINEFLDSEQELIIEPDLGIDYDLRTHEFHVHVCDEDPLPGFHEMYIDAGFEEVC